jgi:hypothetical protein
MARRAQLRIASGFSLSTWYMVPPSETSLTYQHVRTYQTSAKFSNCAGFRSLIPPAAATRTAARSTSRRPRSSQFPRRRLGSSVVWFSCSPRPTRASSPKPSRAGQTRLSSPPIRGDDGRGDADARKSLVQPPASRTSTRPAAASHEFMWRSSSRRTVRQLCRPGRAPRSQPEDIHSSPTGVIRRRAPVPRPAGGS